MNDNRLKGGGGKEKMEDIRLDSNLFNVKKFIIKLNIIFIWFD